MRKPMDLREQIARAICGNWVVGDDRPWQQWTEEADAVLEVLAKQEPVAWQMSHQSWGDGWFDTNEAHAEWLRANKYGEWKVRPLYAAPVARAAVPDGWRLVPIEPTSAMTTAFNTAAEALRQSHLLSGSYPASWQPVEAGYRAMLAAAPEAKP